MGSVSGLIYGIAGVIGTLSTACGDVAHHILDFGRDFLDLATALYRLGNKLGLLLLNILKHIAVWTYQLLYVVTYTGWMIMYELCSSLSWIISVSAEYTWSLCGCLIEYIGVVSKALVVYSGAGLELLWKGGSHMLSWLHTAATAIGGVLQTLASAIWSLLALLLSYIEAAASHIWACTWEFFASLWENTFCTAIASVWVCVYALRDRCAGMLSNVCETLTAPFHVDVFRMHITEVTHDLAHILSSDWYKFGCFFVISGICIYMTGTRVCKYLHRKGFTFPVYHGEDNVINVPNVEFDYIDLSDEEEDLHVRPTINMVLRNYHNLRGNNEEYGDNRSDRSGGDDSNGSQYSNHSDESNASSDSDGNSQLSSDTSEEEGSDISGDDFDDDASDVTELDYEDDRPINVQLPEARYALRSAPRATPSRMTPLEIKRELASEQDRRKCVICTEVDKDVLLLPCRHLCLCITCAHQLVSQRNVTRRVCPLCRGNIESVMNIYL